jgi:RimJ/RimL family protein N-acetyltransferase
MSTRWSERAPALRGQLVTLREVTVSDVDALFALFSDPTVTRYMAPPPPTPAKFAGFVVWSHQQREQGRGLCFAIVPDGMTAAVGILQVRSSDSTPSTAEWGFVLSAHFWSTGVFVDSANLLVEFAFTAMQFEHLHARIALRNRRAQAAVRKLGARPGSTIADTSPMGQVRDPQMMWTLCEDDWRKQLPNSRGSIEEARQRIGMAIEAAQGELRQIESPETVDAYPLFLFDRRRQE